MAHAALFDASASRSAITQLVTGPVYAGLSFRFGVRCADPDLAAYLEAVLSPLRDTGEAEHWYSIATAPKRIEVRLDGVRVARAREPGNAAAWLLWHVNRAVVDASSEHVLLHSAGVSRDGLGVVLPGAPGSGKTTLCAALVQRGYGYLSDEVVAVADDDAMLFSFPKSFALEEGSIEALWGPGGPHGSGGVADHLPGAEKRHVTPDRVRAGAVSGGCRARLVVAPRYRAGCRTALSRLGTADALTVLVANGVNMQRHGGAGIRRLAALAKRSACFTLEFSDLEEACRLVTTETDRQWEGDTCSPKEAVG